jgi:hypothetical protein
MTISESSSARQPEKFGIADLPIKLTRPNDRPCQHCGGAVVATNDIGGLYCAKCGQPRGQMNADTWQFLADVAARFGRPHSVTVRSRKPDAGHCVQPRRAVRARKKVG